MKEKICEVFCDSVSVRQVPAGLALSTTVASVNGDPIGFYAVGPLSDGRYRLEDSGQLVPFLYAVGADLDNEARRQIFEDILDEHSATFDEETLEIISEPIPESEVPGASLKFVSLLLRLSDLAYLARERVASTFKHDATSRLKENLGGKANFREDDPFFDTPLDWEPDMVIEAPDRNPVALFLTQTDHRVMEAMLLHADARAQTVNVTVAALLEREGAVSRRTRIRAINRLDCIAIYDGDEQGAIEHIASAVLGPSAAVH